MCHVAMLTNLQRNVRHMPCQCNVEIYNMSKCETVGTMGTWVFPRLCFLRVVIIEVEHITVCFMHRGYDPGYEGHMIGQKLRIAMHIWHIWMNVDIIVLWYRKVTSCRYNYNNGWRTNAWWCLDLNEEYLCKNSSWWNVTGISIWYSIHKYTTSMHIIHEMLCCHLKP